MMDWKKALGAARAEHDSLVQQRDEFDAEQETLDAKRELAEKRILQLEQTISSLANLVGETPLQRKFANSGMMAALKGGDLDSLKLADACRKVLQSANHYWTPIDVRDALVVQKYNLSAYTNPLASIHAILKRLHDSGEVARMAGENGKTTYRWKAFASSVPGEPPAPRKSINDTLIEESRKLDKK